MSHVLRGSGLLNVICWSATFPYVCVYLSISVRVSSSYVGNQSPCEGEATPELSIYTDLIIFFCLFTLIDVLMKNLTCFLQLCVGSVHL